MAYAAADARDSRQADINITPLVDVMLVLLVLFIVTAPAATRSLAVDLPQRTTGAIAPPGETLHLYVGAGDVYTLDGVAIDRATLTARFAAAAANERGATVEIAADPEADYQSVLQPMADARRTGVANLVFVNR